VRQTTNGRAGKEASACIDDCLAFLRYDAGMDFSSITVLCIGDVMLDRFVHGDIERISPEAPVPVIRLRETRDMLGGAGNVASNIASLGGRAILVGLVAGIADARPGIVASLVETAHRPTICKTRYVAGRQQVVRADEEGTAPLHASEEQALLARVAEHLPAAQAVILSDYGKSVLSPTLIAKVIETATARNIPVFVDPKTDDFSRYRGATCITPNVRELAAAAGASLPTEAAIDEAARRLLDTAEAHAILVTRSEKGMMLIERGCPAALAPARAREVFDVSGAGDTVIAALALAVADGRALAQAMHIANAAAGVVVSKLGTATADIAEVLHELSAQDEQSGLGQLSGLQTLAIAQNLVARWREQGFSVGFTNGCFDILHPGHVALLAFARGQCDRLVVALNDDASVRRLKGAARPVNALDQRARIMAAIRYVDCVVGFEEDTPLRLLRDLRPDVLIKGADYALDQVVGADLVISAGGRVILADLVPGQSTTRIIARMREPAPA
jgi:D-beta-D-heptose 7-phosphate kinase/D-beta-D-heptose 1-phosphate adenosyltransferase